MRIYLPATGELLRAWRSGGVPVSAERWVAEVEDEETEYAALMAAAQDSAALLAGAGRRVVLVAEVDDPDGPAPPADWVAVHADPAERPADADPAEDLAWYGVQEIDDLLG